MTWAQHLKRVVKIDIETCSACGGAMKAIACPNSFRRQSKRERQQVKAAAKQQMDHLLAQNAKL